ncbi:hypothetical protein C7460_11076 [Marinoscillum furvescens DSM 4134]|uniref:Uncharacterized protein n=1 Tax=Marinoscillum furvescens DSM 4134 TaxID=1122208 RepID=A0A3D9L335_MARFU|nr:hypothetical protein C7460_11076 [Marinoscillum furvescens DSM 4134]
MRTSINQIVLIASFMAGLNSFLVSVKEPNNNRDILFENQSITNTVLVVSNFKLISLQ